MASVSNSFSYYPFGMMLPGRQANPGDYRYGFNGQEKSDEIKGTGNSISFKYRMQDARLGRFFSIDPLVNKYPYLTPYQVAHNSPISLFEIEGKEGSLGIRGDANVTQNNFSNVLFDATGDWIPDYNEAWAKAASSSWTFIGSMTGLASAPASALRLGGIGGTIGGGVAMIKGEDSYEVIKATFSGFYAGMAINGSPAKINSLKTFFGAAFKGGFSGFIGSATSQAFDNMFSDGQGYDISKLATGAGIGVFANILATGIIQVVESQIDIVVLNALAKTEDEGYKKIIEQTLKSQYPAMGNQELKRTTNSTISEIRKLIKQQGSELKAAANSVIDKGTNALEEAASE